MATEEERRNQSISMDLSQSDREQLASLFTGVSHSARIAILYGLDDEKPLTEIADDVDVTRGTLQNHVERMIDSDLVYRPSEDSRTYALTAFGEHVLELIDQEAEQLLEAAALVDEEAASIMDSLETAGVSMDDTTRERTVHTQKWEETIEELRDMLE